MWKGDEVVEPDIVCCFHNCRGSALSGDLPKPQWKIRSAEPAPHNATGLGMKHFILEEWESETRSKITVSLLLNK